MTMSISEETDEEHMKIVYYLYKFPKNLKVFMITSVLKKKKMQLHVGSFEMKDQSFMYVYIVSCFTL